MGMAAILLNGGAESFEHIANILFTERPMWNLVKIDQTVSEKKTFSIDFMILYMWIAQGQGQISPKILMVIK